uniref:Uncharacterized protein n=1 Tax=Kwoniella bestiolae CBS 10118 TaxID=1296100 RepID=A0A1B9G6E8_9TREE|nr:hypothetical protein I302_04295 [Kwoniella bestiolae CBS 10118]OCF26609.1 hypothetical protein I302_04295 [Kwoniella bestiolae CBS 10118]
MLIPTALVDTTVDGKTFTTATSTQEGSSSQLFPQGFKGEGETQQPFISEESKSSEEANSDLDSDSDSDWSQSDAPRGKYTIYQCMTNGMNFKVNHDVNVGLSGQVPQVVELESTLTNYYTPRSESDSPHCAAAFADYVRAKESEPEAISRLKELHYAHKDGMLAWEYTCQREIVRSYEMRGPES